MRLNLVGLSYNLIRPLMRRAFADDIGWEVPLKPMP